MAEFLHKKDSSSLWYFRRRYPVEVAKVVGKTMHMQSLQTANRREAEKLCRAVSVQFDAICAEARREHKFQEEKRQVELVAAQGAEAKRVDGAAGADSQRSPESVLARVPELMRLAAIRVVEEQQRDPQGWLDTIRRWKDFYSAANLQRNRAQYSSLLLPSRGVRQTRKHGRCFVIGHCANTCTR